MKAGTDRLRIRKHNQKESKMLNPSKIEFKNDDERKLFFMCGRYFNAFIDFKKFVKACDGDVTDDKINQYRTTLSPLSCLCPDFAKGTTVKPVICKHLIYLFIKNQSQASPEKDDGVLVPDTQKFFTI